MTNERKQFLHDVFVTAVEGGINYWASVKKYHWTNAPKGADNDTVLAMADNDGFYAEIVDEDAEKNHRIDMAVIQHGLALIRAGEVKCMSAEMRKYIIAADAVNDAGDIDAGLADNIVQVGLFNELVYG